MVSDASNQRALTETVPLSKNSTDIFGQGPVKLNKQCNFLHALDIHLSSGRGLKSTWRHGFYHPVWFKYGQGDRNHTWEMITNYYWMNY